MLEQVIWSINLDHQQNKRNAKMEVTFLFPDKNWVFL